MDYKLVLIIIGYVLIINSIGFLSMYIDKRKAKNGKWRIKEWTLITIAFLGGGIGSLIGMKKFRHKTQKPKFKYGIPAIIIIETLIIIYCLVVKITGF